MRGLSSMYKDAAGNDVIILVTTLGKMMNRTLGNLKIEPLERTPDNLQAVLSVYQQCEDFLALGPVDKASMAMVLSDLELSDKEGGVFHAIYRLDSGEMIGIVDFVTGGYQGHPELAFLSLLMIAAAQRGQGVGQRVVEAVEAEMRSSGLVETILSGVQVNNPRAIHFWQRMGYQVISGPEHMADGTTAYQLAKPLCAARGPVQAAGKETV